jgi:hypothetical protein
LEEGFGTVKLVVIVLVVLAQGVSSLMKWLKRKNEEARQRDAMLGLPGSRDEEPESDSDADTDWDRYARQDEPEVVLQPVPSQASVRVLREEQTQPVALTPVAAAVAPPPDPAPSALMHRVISAHGSRPKAGRQTSPVARPTLRSMMLAKVVLDRPVSARHGSARSHKD